MAVPEQQNHFRFRVKGHVSKTFDPRFWRKKTPETTIIYRSIHCSGHLVVFVHGFNGSASATWTQFPERTITAPVFRACDVIYYGYDGVRTQAQDSGDILYKFVDSVISSPTQGVIPSLLQLLERSASFTYKRITFVAHSLGAVVTRIALLDAYQERRPWLGRAELVLYAPAHMGSRISRLAAEALTGIPYIAGIGGVIAWKLKVLKDLEEGSQLLRLLQKDTEKAVQTATQLRAKAVVVSSADEVVINTRFPGDPLSDRIDTATHVTICKPAPDFEDPAKFLYAQLR